MRLYEFLNSVPLHWSLYFLYQGSWNNNRGKTFMQNKYIFKDHSNLNLLTFFKCFRGAFFEPLELQKCSLLLRRQYQTAGPMYFVKKSENLFLRFWYPFLPHKLEGVWRNNSWMGHQFHLILYLSLSSVTLA